MMAERLYAWFRYCLPTLASKETTQQREQLRKSSLLAMVILVSLSLDIPILVIDVLTANLFPCLCLCVAISIAFFALWLNRRGHLELAALAYLALMFVAIIGFTILRNNAHANVLWIIFLAIPTLLGGFFLKRWMPCIFGALDCGIVTVAWLFPQRFSWSGLNHIPVDFLSDIYLLLISIALIASLYAWSVERAVRQADRAEELEQLLTRFKETNEELHVLQGDLLNNNIALREANARLESLATTDPLTGLLNHRALSEFLDVIWGQTRRMQNSFALLFFDIDHFKTINDTFGHKSGDDVLQAFARIVHQSLRDNDVVGRWGGEEFVAILPDIDEAHAREIAERVRQAVDSTTFAIGKGIHLTCSIGVACCHQHSSNQQELLDAADRAMYAAKHTGRNRVCIAPQVDVRSAA